MFLSVFSRFSACRSSLVKLLSGKEADCKVEAILLLMLSLTGSDRSLWRDRTASTLDTIVPLTVHYHNDSEDDDRSGCRNVSHCHQQFFSELHSPGRSHYTNYFLTNKFLKSSVTAKNV